MGELLMNKFYFHHNPKKLPEFDEQCHPVQLYDLHKWNSGKHSIIARKARDTIRDLGCKIDNDAFDFFTIAMSVTAADSFCDRSRASDNAWARDFELYIPLSNPELWIPVKNKIEKALGYLTGDQWRLNFSEGGIKAPLPKRTRKSKLRRKTFQGLDSVCLFSGGLDSAVGAIDLINNGNSSNPLLISHAYKGDASKQNSVEQVLNGKYGRLSFNADPHILNDLSGRTDITMRGRSFNFLAMAIIGSSVVKKVNGVDSTKVFIPENGYISLNPPLTSRRIGSLSTRTTHPHFLSMMQEIFDIVGFDVVLENPYQFKTKGEMLKECKDQTALKIAIPNTVSCSNWHRKGIQCGRCVPCAIRRASILEAGFSKDANYDLQRLSTVLKLDDQKDDILALSSAIIKLKNTTSNRRWVRQSGPLPLDTNSRDGLVKVFERGLREVEKFLKSESVI